MTDSQNLKPVLLVVGNKYNFKSQSERLVYMGRHGTWHQFALISNPDAVWAEVSPTDLHMIEATKETSEPYENFEEPLPHYASARANGQLVVGALLPTKDGRRVGNGRIVEIGTSKWINKTVFTVVTDMGNEMILTESELTNLYYPPVYVAKTTPDKEFNDHIEVMARCAKTLQEAKSLIASFEVPWDRVSLSILNERQVSLSLKNALSDFLNMYLENVASGDWGKWDAEKDIEVINARLAIEKYKELFKR